MADLLQITQIVPRLPPAISGVGDYALLLARELRKTHQVDTKFVLTDTDWRGESRIDGFEVERLPRKTDEVLRAAMGNSSARWTVLHYVGYAYAPKGCPLWLIRALERTVGLRTEPPQPLITMFHELYATGPLWTSAGLTSTFQKRLTKRLARLSDICFTNRYHSALELNSMRRSHKEKARVFPVFSNFGEPLKPAALAQRRPQAIWFGGLGRSVRNVTKTLAHLRNILRQFEISKLIVIGTNRINLEAAGIHCERHVHLVPEVASRLLSESRFGFLDYYDGYLGKSGIFAAYCSHGLVPILFEPNASEADGLECGRHFLLASSVNDPGTQVQQIADAAWTWYHSHNVAKTAIAFAQAFRQMHGQESRIEARSQAHLASASI